MANDDLTLQVITPTGVAFKATVQSLTAPSISGEFGMLPGHRPVVAALRTGLVSFMRDGQPEKLAVHQGFVRAADNQAVLLTERMITKDQIDILDVREKLKKAEADLVAFTGSPADPIRLGLIEEQQWLAAQLDMIGDPVGNPVISTSTRYSATVQAARAEAEALKAQESAEGA